MELLTAVAAVLGAGGSLVAAVGVLIVNEKLDKLIGRASSLGRDHERRRRSPVTRTEEGRSTGAFVEEFRRQVGTGGPYDRV